MLATLTVTVPYQLFPGVGVFQEHFPERLGGIVLLKPPIAFGALYVLRAILFVAVITVAQLTCTALIRIVHLAGYTS